MAEEKPIAVYGAMGANLLIAIAKIVAGLVGGSSAMIAEAIHSAIDTGNEALLLVGLRRAKQPADREHPFGHGKELYFWGLLVAVVLFGIGGGMSVYEGIRGLLHGQKEGNRLWSYIVLGVSLVFESGSWALAWRSLRRDGATSGVVSGVTRSKDPSKFVPLAEDTAAIAGILVAFAGLLASQLLHSNVPDGIASIVIGLILAGVAVSLVIETRGLLLGESADEETVGAILDIAEEDERIDSISLPLTMHFGPDEILVNVDVRFADSLSAESLLDAIGEFEAAVRERCPAVKRMFIEAQLGRRRHPPRRTPGGGPAPRPRPKGGGSVRAP